MTLGSGSDRFTKIYLLLWGITVLVGLVALIFYKFGYRLTKELEPVKVGSIELASNENRSQIFLNNREQQLPLENGRYVLRKITPGLHSILVSKDGFWPWAKTVAVAPNNTRPLYAFTFPMEGVTVKTVPANTPEHGQTLKTLLNYILPELKLGSPPLRRDESLSQWLVSNVPSLKLSSDKTTALYVEDNTAYVAWISETEPPPHYFCLENPCKPTIPVIIPNEPLKTVDFYKNRHDVILFAAGAAIYAIEADREGTQNFQPLYKGTDPYFYQTGSGRLYISDRGALLQAEL